MAKKILSKPARTATSRTISTKPATEVAPENRKVVQDLLAKLAAKPESNQQKAVRRKLRSLGHRGGLRQTPATRTVAKVKTRATGRKPKQLSEVKPAGDKGTGEGQAS